MKFQLLSAFLTIIILGSCDLNSTSSSTSDITKNSNDTEYAFITEIQQDGDSTYLIADYVQYLTGDSAIAAAIQEGNADTTEIEGKITVGVSNDYYILNSNQKLRKLPVVKNCEFDFLLWLDRVDVKKVDNSLSSLKKIYKDAPFILTLDKNETVVRVKEVYLP